MVEVVIFHQVCEFDSNHMGTNEPTVSDMKQSYFVNGCFTQPSVDVTIIAGRPSNGQKRSLPVTASTFLEWSNQFQKGQRMGFL